MMIRKVAPRVTSIQNINGLNHSPPKLKYKYSKYRLLGREERKRVPVRHNDWGKKTPNVEQHAHPTRNNSHPHCHFRATNENVVIRIRCTSRNGRRLDDIPKENSKKSECAFRTRKSHTIECDSCEEYLPVRKQHCHIHSSNCEDDVEPRILDEKSVRKASLRRLSYRSKRLTL